MSSKTPSQASSQASWMRFAQKVRVPAGTALGIIFLLFMHPSVRSLMIGGFFTLTGALVRIWAAGHIEKRIRLARSGPYAYTRNPLYLGSFFMAFGVILAGQGYWLLPFFALFFIGVYLPVMRAEEQELAHAYGVDFLEYAGSTPLFFPKKPTPAQKLKKIGSQVRFSWPRVRKNREHRNLVSLLAVEGILIIILLQKATLFAKFLSALR
jgi:protein-S-isoprenylcysteine O-methyltransferase Ste14